LSKSQGEIFFKTIGVIFSTNGVIYNSMTIETKLINKNNCFEDNFYINIHELINIHIAADSHPITFV